MQTVNHNWLRKLSLGLLAIDLIFIIATLIAKPAGLSGEMVTHWGLHPISAGILAIHAVYVVFGYNHFSKDSPWLASLISNLIFGFFIASILESSGGSNYVYWLVCALFMFVTPMAGLVAPVASIILIWIIYMFAITGALRPAKISLVAYTAANLIVTLGAFLSWLFFKRYYLDSGSNELATLSNMLQQEQLKSDILIESMGDGVLLVSNEGIIKTINQSAATMLGWTKHDAENLDYKLVVNYEDDSPADSSSKPSLNSQTTKDVIQKCLSSKSPSQATVKLQSKHQKVFFADILVSPIFKHNSGQDDEHQMVGAVAIIRDVDQAKQEEQQKSEFISTASHEMRTPVASIQGFIELALNPKVANIDDKARGYLIKADEASKHLGELFQDLLTASKSEDGRLNYKIDKVNLLSLLYEIVEQYKPKAEAKGLTVVTDFQNNNNKVMPLMDVMADPERLREVLSNLFDNAVKYSPDGQINIGAVVHDDKNVIISISDQGIGIAEEDMPHMFQKFYRTDNSKTREIGGTGLGLYISKQIIENMNGRIWVNSQLGEGSTFYIELPRALD